MSKRKVSVHWADEEGPEEGKRRIYYSDEDKDQDLLPSVTNDTDSDVDSPIYGLPFSLQVPPSPSISPPPRAFEPPPPMSPQSPILLPVFSDAIISRVVQPQHRVLARDTCPFFPLMQRARVIAAGLGNELEAERGQNRALVEEIENLEMRLSQTRLTVELQERELRQTKESLANVQEWYTVSQDQLATKKMLESRCAALEPMLERANTRTLALFYISLLRKKPA